MGVKMINQLHKYISEEKPDEGDLRKFVKDMANRADYNGEI